MCIWFYLKLLRCPASCCNLLFSIVKNCIISVHSQHFQLQIKCIFSIQCTVPNSITYTNYLILIEEKLFFFLASWFEHVFNLLQDHPITPFGHLIHNKDDSRRKPLHVATDITQITFMAVILKVRIVYFKQQIIEKKIKLSV